MESKEEKAIILDFLPNGYPLEHRRMPIAQAIGLSHFTLLELIPRKGVKLQLKEEVYIGPEKREKIYFIRGKLFKNKLTETAKLQIQDFVEKIVEEKEKKFVDFFNNAEAINTRLHQFELLPGFGKKYMKMILDEREKKIFISFEDMKKRLKNLPDPKKTVEKRLIEELTQEIRYKLFAA
jgi:putative nucleotide binding protein